jgi:hypothetical protein
VLFCLRVISEEKTEYFRALYNQKYLQESRKSLFLSALVSYRSFYLEWRALKQIAYIIFLAIFLEKLRERGTYKDYSFTTKYVIDLSE